MYLRVDFGVQGYEPAACIDFPDLDSSVYIPAASPSVLNLTALKSQPCQERSACSGIQAIPATQPQFRGCHSCIYLGVPRNIPYMTLKEEFYSRQYIPRVPTCTLVSSEAPYLPEHQPSAATWRRATRSILHTLAKQEGGVVGGHSA